MWKPPDWRRRELGLNADINVTSLVDVAFTLLVIFIITAPILQGGVEVQLPRAEVAPITSSEGVIVTVDADGSLFIDEIAVASEDEFRALFPEYVEEQQVQQAYLKGHRDAPYGSVLRVLAIMKRLDVAEVGLVGEPETETGG